MKTYIIINWIGFKAFGNRCNWTIWQHCPQWGVQSVEEGLRENPNNKVPFGFITRLMKIILVYSLFEFDEKLYQQ